MGVQEIVKPSKRCFYLLQNKIISLTLACFFFLRGPMTLFDYFPVEIHKFRPSFIAVTINIESTTGSNMNT